MRQDHGECEEPNGSETDDRKRESHHIVQPAEFLKIIVLVTGLTCSKCIKQDMVYAKLIHVDTSVLDLRKIFMMDCHYTRHPQERRRKMTLAILRHRSVRLFDPTRRHIRMDQAKQATFRSVGLHTTRTQDNTQKSAREIQGRT